MHEDLVQNLCEFCQFFLYDFLGTKCPDTPKSHTADADHYWLSFGVVSAS